ncbi:MAG: pyruvoyl-dependent arginine decarboxylase [Candidatus Glassbacteria bacterium]
MEDKKSVQSPGVSERRFLERHPFGPAPRTVFLTSGSAEGGSSLNAFDNALLNAGIGDLNLIRVTSIAPPGVKTVKPYGIEPGTIVPVVYTSMISHQAGERIACAIAIGRSGDDGPGLIMEYSGSGDAQLAETMVRNMLKEGFFSRGRELEKLEVVTSEHVVRQLGAVVAACVFGF